MDVRGLESADAEGHASYTDTVHSLAQSGALPNRTHMWRKANITSTNQYAQHCIQKKAATFPEQHS